MGRRNGLARGIYNRIVEDDRFAKKQILSEVQLCLSTMLLVSGFSAHQMVFRSNPMDLFGWEGQDEDLLFAQDTSLAGQFAQQWKLRMQAREATLGEIAKSKLRRLLAQNKSFNCTDVAVGDSVLFYKAKSRKSSPRWGGRAKILEIYETGLTVFFQSRTFKVARFCVRNRLKEKDVAGEEWKNSLRRGSPWMESPAGGAGLAPDVNENRPDTAEMVDGDKPTGNGYQSTTEPEETVMASRRLIPAPASPVHSAKEPRPTLLHDSSQTSEPSNRNCAPSRAPQYDSANYDHLPNDQLREL